MKAFKKVSILTAIFALFLTFSVSSAFAQVGNKDQGQKAQPETYTLTGKVVDWESGDAIANATVLVAGNKMLNAQTDAQGKFTIESLKAGTYTIVIKADNYKTWKKKVTVKADKELKVKLKPKLK